MNSYIPLWKDVVAMHKADTPQARPPKAVAENNVPVVPWNQRELEKAIKKQSENS